MRRNIVVLTMMLAFFAVPLFAAETYEAGIKRAKAENKHLVLYFFSKYCGYCEKMEKEVLTDKEIAGALKQDFVFVELDADKRQDLFETYGVRVFPVTYFSDPKAKAVVAIPGYIGKKDFKKLLAYTKGRLYDKVPLKEYLRGKGWQGS